MEKQIRKIPKRIVTKIGDVFCVDFPNNTKGYFQYIANDLTDLNSSVIRVFKRHYSSDAPIDINDIINDEIDFYAHTILRSGIASGAWYKIGKSEETGLSELEKVIFGHINETIIVKRFNRDYEIIDVNPLEHWEIWNVNKRMRNLGKLPKKYHGKVEIGWVVPYDYIIQRMISGYYCNTSEIYEIIKRNPRPEYRSYLKFTENGKMVYICFQGDGFNKAIFEEKGVCTKITQDFAAINHLEIATKKFSDTNWRYQDFITENEFNEKWFSIE